jgi:hypothetical protein
MTRQKPRTSAIAASSTRHEKSLDGPIPVCKNERAPVRSRRTIMRGFFRLICIALPAIFPLPSLAATAAASLCKADEMTVFSCRTSALIASVCASKGLSSGDSYLQYRYGRTGKVDLSYPKTGTKPADAFTSGIMIFSGGGGTWLRFSNGAFRYSVFTAIGKWGSKGDLADAAGVFVEKDGKRFANFPCRSDAEGEMGADVFKKLGIDVAGPEAEFNIPRAFLLK